MRPRNLIIAAIVLAALSIGVWWSNQHPQQTTQKTSSGTPETSTKLADIPDTDVQQITIAKKGGGGVTVDHSGGKWVISAPQQLPADQDAVTSMVSSLNPLTADSVVEQASSDLAQYGLAAPVLTVSVKEKNGKSETISFGDDVPAGSQVYVRTSDSPKIYAIASSARSSFDKTLNDLRDKRMLTLDMSKLTQIEIEQPKANFVLAKMNGKDWQIVKPKPYRADSFQVEELTRKLGDAKMDLSGMEDQKAIDAAFNTGQRVATVKLTGPSGTQTLEVRKNKSNYYAKSSAVAGIYKVSSDLGQQLEKSLDDYRNHKIFDFGFTDPNKIEIKQGANDKTYIRTGDTWKLNGQTLDSASVQTLIDKLRDLSATKFVDKGFTTPALEIAVTYNDNKSTEQVSFAKVADGYIAKRGNEAAMYLVDAKAVDDILSARDAIKPSTSGGKK